MLGNHIKGIHFALEVRSFNGQIPHEASNFIKLRRPALTLRLCFQGFIGSLSRL